MDRKILKKKIYKNRNLITYIIIFGVASIITVGSTIGRNDKVVLIDNSQLDATHKESVAIKNKTTQKFAAKSEESVSSDSQDETGTTVVIAVDTLNIRSQKEQDSEPLGLANQGDEFTIISKDAQWVEIDFNGNNGFVKRQYVNIK